MSKIKLSKNFIKNIVKLALNEDLHSAKYPVFMQDQLVWVGDLSLVQNEVVTLVTAPEGCIYRRRAIEALKQAGINYRIAYSNADLTGLTAALKEGLGITVLAKSTVPNELNYQLQTKRLPELGQIGISLIKRADQPDNAADKLAEFIALRLT